MPHQQTTAFAPAQRAAPERILEQSRAFVDSHCRAFFDTLPTLILALNCQRQVVFANTAAVSFLGYSECAQVLGKRPGEALGCVNADAAPAGCGTSTHCRNCGAVQAILAAVQGDVGDGECPRQKRNAWASREQRKPCSSYEVPKKKPWQMTLPGLFLGKSLCVTEAR